jgi:hypothetical protein
MTTAATVIRWLVRVLGLVMVSLGLLFWTGNALALLPVHMLAGLVLVLSLWALALLAALTGVSPGLVALAVVWGFIVPTLGLTQDEILRGDGHWVIQIVHLLVGLGAIGQAEGLAARILQARARARTEAVGAGRP